MLNLYNQLTISDNKCTAKKEFLLSCPLFEICDYMARCHKTFDNHWIHIPRFITSRNSNVELEKSFCVNISKRMHRRICFPLVKTHHMLGATHRSSSPNNNKNVVVRKNPFLLAPRVNNPHSSTVYFSIRFSSSVCIFFRIFRIILLRALFLSIYLWRARDACCLSVSVYLSFVLFKHMMFAMLFIIPGPPFHSARVPFSFPIPRSKVMCC